MQTFFMSTVGTPIHLTLTASSCFQWLWISFSMLWVKPSLPTKEHARKPHNRPELVKKKEISMKDATLIFFPWWSDWKARRWFGLFYTHNPCPCFPHNYIADATMVKCIFLNKNVRTILLWSSSKFGCPCSTFQVRLMKKSHTTFHPKVQT